jgi:hypothetical protein
LPDIICELQQRDFTTSVTARHLGIELGKTIEDTMRETPKN